MIQVCETIDHSRNVVILDAGAATAPTRNSALAAKCPPSAPLRQRAVFA